MYVLAVLQACAMRHDTPLNCQNWYCAGSLPPNVSAVHVIVVPTGAGSGTFAVKLATEIGSGKPRTLNVESDDVYVGRGGGDIERNTAAVGAAEGRGEDQHGIDHERLRPVVGIDIDRDGAVPPNRPFALAAILLTARTLMTLFDQIQRALSAEGIAASLETLFLVVRMNDDSAHVSIRRAPSEDEAREWFKTEGRRFTEPVLIGRVQGDTRPVELPPHRTIESSESLSNIADEAYLWRGYSQNTRGVVNFRRGRFDSQVNAPSVDDAIAVARGLSALLA